MEIQSLSVLLDIKTSIRKKCYRHVINLVQKKLQKDLLLQNSAHLIQILFKQIEAVHKLLEQVIIGKFDKNIQKIVKLFKIMNRNLQKCFNIFQQYMNRLMIHLNKDNKTKGSFNFKNKQQEDIKKNIQQYIPLVLNSCYYIHIFNLISGVTAPEYQVLAHQLKIILQHYIQKQPLKLKQQLTIIRIYLLLMAINIKNNNYEIAKMQFYSAISHILISFRILQKNIKVQKKEYSHRRRKLLVLVLIGLINHQRALIECDNFIGWDLGFTILKNIQKQLKMNQGRWGKFFRNQHENYNIMLSKKQNQVKEIFIPFLMEQSQIFKTFLGSAKHSIYMPLTTQCTKLHKKHITHKKTYYPKIEQPKTDAVYENLSQQNYMITCKVIKSKKFIQPQSQAWPNSFFKKPQPRLNKNYMRKSHKNVDKSKFPFICDFQFDKTTNFQIQDTVTDELNIKPRLCDLTERNQKQQLQLKLIQKGQMQKGFQTVIKKLTRKPQLSNNTKKFTLDIALQIGKQLVKQKSNKYAMHKLLNQQKQLSLNYISQYNTIKLAYSTKQLKETASQQKKSIDTSVFDIFKKILVANKNKLRLRLLVDKYETVKKRKKVRNYHYQMLQFQLQKNISNIVINNRSDSYAKRSSVLGRPSCSYNNFKYTSQQKEKQNHEKIMENTYNKSKQIIKQMLKKLAPPNETKNKKIKLLRNIERSFNNSLSYDTFR